MLNLKNLLLLKKLVLLADTNQKQEYYELYCQLLNLSEEELGLLYQYFDASELYDKNSYLWELWLLLDDKKLNVESAMVR